jgi:CHAD domain-containing protein
MMQTSHVANPVEQLREQAKRLQAALSVGVASPTAKAVHALRSSTRRVEAQLELLTTLEGLPPYRPIAQKVLRRLEKLRRVAGRVRDCDVQDKLLKDEDHAMSSAVEAPSDIQSTQEKLRKRVGKDRQRNESKLIAAIERQLPKLARNTEELLAALKPATELEVPVDELLATIEHNMERMLRSDEKGEEHLHDVRKAAKRARYQCESIPGPQAASMAKRLEDLQDAGGAWHDLLDLATASHDEFGAEHPLSRVLEQLRDERLESYLADLENFRKKLVHAEDVAAMRKPPQRAVVASEPKRNRTIR